MMLSQGEREQYLNRIFDLETRLAVLKKQFETFELPGLDLDRVTYSERAILKVLHDHKGSPVSVDHIYDALYALKPGADWPEIKIITVMISKLRRKMTQAPWEIKTVWGTGYLLREVGR